MRFQERARIWSATISTVGLVASAVGGPPAHATTPVPHPSVSFATCPPTPPVTGSVVRTGATSITVGYRATARPPGCAMSPVVVVVFSTAADAQLWLNPKGSAASAPGQASGELTVTGLATNTDYWYRMYGGGSDFSTLPMGPARTGSGSGSGCDARYQIEADWGEGFVVRVTVRNTSARTTKGWQVSWSWPGDQRVAGAWNATMIGSETHPVATDAGYNGTLAPGEETSFGLVVLSASAAPATFRPSCVTPDGGSTPPPASGAPSPSGRAAR